jgi:DeoR family fructose operon transcriptional repressor
MLDSAATSTNYGRKTAKNCKRAAKLRKEQNDMPSTVKGEHVRKLPAGRKALLLAQVNNVGEVTVAALAETFGVSIDTIRRDLDSLDHDGLLIRTHGGAISMQAGQFTDRDVDFRLKINHDEKQSIARAARALIKDGAVLLMNAGTTTLALAQKLQDARDLTIATNNLLIPQTVAHSCLKDLYLFGGSVRYLTQSTTGPVALHLADTTGPTEVHADLAFIAVGAVSATHGYSTTNAGEATLMRSMMEKSDQVAVLADSSKLDRTLFSRVSDLSAADYLITNAPPSEELQRALTEVGTKLIISG